MTVLGGGYNKNKIADPITWLTAQVSYNMNDGVTVSLEGPNLFNERCTYNIDDNPPLARDCWRHSRSIALGVSMRF